MADALQTVLELGGWTLLVGIWILGVIVVVVLEIRDGLADRRLRKSLDLDNPDRPRVGLRRKP